MFSSLIFCVKVLHATFSLSITPLKNADVSHEMSCFLPRVFKLAAYTSFRHLHLLPPSLETMAIVPRPDEQPTQITHGAFPSSPVLSFVPFTRHKLSDFQQPHYLFKAARLLPADLSPCEQPQH